MTVPADLDRRFRETASRAGFLDAAYDVIDSELGPLLAAVTDRGLARISFDPEPERELEALARLAGPRVLRAPGALDETRRELDDYFAGRRTAFDLALDLRGLTDFTLRVLSELGQVTYGHTLTYGELAERAGNPRASRAVGMVMNRNRIPIVLPCHASSVPRASWSATAAASSARNASCGSRARSQAAPEIARARPCKRVSPRRAPRRADVETPQAGPHPASSHG